MELCLTFIPKTQDGVLTLEEASKTFRVMGKRPTGKKIMHFFSLLRKIYKTLFCNIYGHFAFDTLFPNSEDEILKMVREVSDDKKNDSLEFNEFLKVKLKALLTK